MEYKVPTFKVVLIGDNGVGKTSILNRFVKNTFSDRMELSSTPEFVEKEYEHNGKKVILQIWDTLGQERFRDLTGSFFRECNGILITFDLTNAPSFNNVDKWMMECASQRCKNVPKVLVANKLDLADRRFITRPEVENKANEHGIPFVEASALTGDGVVDAFDKLCELVFEYEEVKRTTKTLEKQKSTTDATQSDNNNIYTPSENNSRSKKDKKGKKDGHCSIC